MYCETIETTTLITHKYFLLFFLMKTYSTNQIINLLSRGCLIEELTKDLKSVDSYDKKDTMKGKLIFNDIEEDYHFVSQKDGTYGLPHFTSKREK